MKVFKYIGLPFKYLGIGLIYMYKGLISPLLPNMCIYRPSCSTFGLISVKRFGIIKGSYLTFKRIMRCAPNHEGGTDRVPEDIKGDFKWIL